VLSNTPVDETLTEASVVSAPQRLMPGIGRGQPDDAPSRKPSISGTSRLRHD